jgi:hypothetical protein
MLGGWNADFKVANNKRAQRPGNLVAICANVHSRGGHGPRRRLNSRRAAHPRIAVQRNGCLSLTAPKPDATTVSRGLAEMRQSRRRALTPVKASMTDAPRTIWLLGRRMRRTSAAQRPRRCSRLDSCQRVHALGFPAWPPVASRPPSAAHRPSALTAAAAPARTGDADLSKEPSLTGLGSPRPHHRQSDRRPRLSG